MITRKIFFVRLCILIALHAFAFNSYAQKWVDMMNDHRVNYYDVVEEANRYFEEHGKGKGQGWKQFQRWSYETKFHIDSKGNRIDPSLARKEFRKFQAKASTIKSLGTTANWTELGPKSWNRTSAWNPGVGRVTSIAVQASNNQIIYVGSPGGGVWKTSNGGTSWIPLTDQLPTMSIYSIVIDPSNSNTLYIGTYGGGIFKSTNAGTSWTQLTVAGLDGYSTVNKIIVHPTNSSIVLAATNSGVFKSTNAGSSWTQSDFNGSFNDIEFKPGDPNIVYASNYNFYRSTNGGNSFTQVTSGITTADRSMIGISPANPNYVYLVQAESSEFGVLYKSTNSGVDFSATVIGDAANGTNFFGYSSDGRSSGGQAWYDMAITVNPTNAEDVYIAGIIVWRSSNGGFNFTPLTEWFLPNTLGYNHADVHALEFMGSVIYSGSDGGIYKSTDLGDNWIDLSTGLGIRQLYRLGCSVTDAAVITTGAQDNGTSMRKASGWIDWLGADGMETFVDRSNANIAYGTSQNGYLYKTTDGGQNYSGLNRPVSYDGNWVTPWVADPVNANTSYIGYNEIYKTTDGGNSWTQISNFGTFSNFDVLAVAPSNSQVIYASRYSDLFRTTNGGATWTDITNNVVNGMGGYNQITAISINPINANKVVVSTSGTAKVVRSIDGGNTWSNISGTLPNIPANAIVYQNNAAEGMYVGMDIGVYYKDNTLADWAPFHTNLPKVKVSELEIQYSSGKLRVATYGRGVWESDLYSTGGNQAPTASITAPSNNATFAAPANISIAASASDVDGTISKVEFFQGATKLGEDLTSPFSFAWNNVAAGSYSLTVVATDNGGATGTSAVISVTVTGTDNCSSLPAYGPYPNIYNSGDRVKHNNVIYECQTNNLYNVTPGTAEHWWKTIGPCGGGNQAPTTSITSPANNASFTAPATIVIAADANDIDGTISKVEFYQGSTKLGEDLTSPYSFNWTGVVAGTYALTSRATDNGGATTTSTTITVVVSNSNVAPTASITSPANNASFTAPATIAIAADANDGDGTISKVEFYQGTTKLGEDATLPYTFSWSGVAAGTYSLTAKAIDNLGASGTSSPVSITVTGGNVAPTASITSPANNASFTAPATIAIAATANDGDGTISKVEFYQGTTKLGEDATLPYTFSWSGVAAGTYSLTAKAIDNLGASGTSSAVNITVTGSDNCASIPQYIENNGYIAGSMVKNGTRKYECKEYPFTAWCNGAAWAYAPGSGTYWADAWYDRGSCAARVAGQSELEEMMNSFMLSPNPTASAVEVSFKQSTSTPVIIHVYNSFGKEISVLENFTSGSSIDLTNYAAGIYNLSIEIDGLLVNKKVVKN